MTEPGSLQGELIAARERIDNLDEEIQQRLRDGDPGFGEIAALVEERAREYHKCAQAAGDPNEIMMSLVVLCSAIAERHPREAIELAEQFYRYPAREDALVNFVDALHIAYKTLGDPVRAEQQRATSMRLRREYAERHGNNEITSTWSEFMSALRRARTPSADSRAYTIDPGTTHLESWLATKTQLSSMDLAPTFGNFVSNDRRFYRVARDRLQMLLRRLRVGMSKPDKLLTDSSARLGQVLFCKGVSRAAAG
jgi:hypothetical protein